MGARGVGDSGEEEDETVVARGVLGMTIERGRLKW